MPIDVFNDDDDKDLKRKSTVPVLFSAVPNTVIDYLNGLEVLWSPNGNKVPNANGVPDDWGTPSPMAYIKSEKYST